MSYHHAYQSPFPQPSFPQQPTMSNVLPSSTPLFLQPRPQRIQPPKRVLSKDENEEIRFAFDSLDLEKKGYVSQRQLKVALRAFGFPVHKSEVVDILRRHGEDDNDKLDLSIFSKVVTEKLQERSFEDDMMRAFQLFDVLGQGQIDKASLRKVVKSLCLDMPDAELEDMIQEFDSDGDGMISFQDFMNIMSATED